MKLPRIIFGSSALGNLYQAIPYETKRAIAAEWMRAVDSPVIDSAGKYGAGLALESIGHVLRDLDIEPSEVTISNKLGWKRIPLKGEEPTFERGVWKELENDAENVISYDGILECHAQGNELLGGYKADLLSIHDPDEYLADAASDAEAQARYSDIREGYRALSELKDRGEARAIGIGAKDWRIIERVYRDGVPLDWAMFANSFTIYSHPDEVRSLLAEMESSGVTIINSAVFHGGFLLGSDYFDYQPVTRDERPRLFEWRERFHALCEAEGVSAAHVCCQFALSAPGTAALAPNTSRAERVHDNVRYVTEPIGARFWSRLGEEELVDKAALVPLIS